MNSDNKAGENRFVPDIILCCLHGWSDSTHDRYCRKSIDTLRLLELLLGCWNQKAYVNTVLMERLEAFVLLVKVTGIKSNII